jgi:hypothetical protein
MITPKYSSAPAKSSPAHRQKGNEVVARIDQPWTLAHHRKHLAVVLRRIGKARNPMSYFSSALLLQLIIEA